MPVIRIEGPIEAARAAGLVAAIQGIVASLPPSLRTQLEIDHDSATARLAGYAAFLGALRSALPGTRLFATALPTWLASPDFPAFAQAADVLILQVHSIDDPRLGLFDPARAARWVDALARRTSRPFLVALPAYGARAAATGGRLLAVSSEMHAMDGMAGMEATDALLPAAVPLPPDCGAADGVGQYRLEGRALTLRGNALLPPHGSVTAGWVRCPAGEVDAAG